jgi:hypothetical protein
VLEGEPLPSTTHMHTPWVTPPNQVSHSNGGDVHKMPLQAHPTGSATHITSITASPTSWRDLAASHITRQCAPHQSLTRSRTHLSYFLAWRPRVTRLSLAGSSAVSLAPYVTHQAHYGGLQPLSLRSRGTTAMCFEGCTLRQAQRTCTPPRSTLPTRCDTTKGGDVLSPTLAHLAGIATTTLSITASPWDLAGEVVGVVVRVGPASPESPVPRSTTASVHTG